MNPHNQMCPKPLKGTLSQLLQRLWLRWAQRSLQNMTQKLTVQWLVVETKLLKSVQKLLSIGDRLLALYEKVIAATEDCSCDQMERIHATFDHLVFRYRMATNRSALLDVSVLLCIETH